jgi:DHA1 family tetracycline resistance protein-like MFS transporter
MPNTFAFFTETQTPYYIPGAPMILGAVLTIAATFMARSSLKKKAVILSTAPVVNESKG